MRLMLVGPAPGEGESFYLKFTMRTSELNARLAFLARIERRVTAWPLSRLCAKQRVSIAVSEARYFKPIDTEAHARLLVEAEHQSHVPVSVIRTWIDAERRVTEEVLSRAGTRSPQGLMERLR